MHIAYCRTCNKAIAAADRKIYVPSHELDDGTVHTDIKVLQVSDCYETKKASVCECELLDSITDEFKQFFL